MGAKNPMLISDPDEVEKSWDKGKKDDEVKEEKTKNSPLHKAGGTNSQYEKDGTLKKKKVEEGKFSDAVQGGLKKTFNKVDELSKTKVGKPVTKVLKTIFGPNKGNKGKDYPTAADQKEKGLRTGG